MRSLVTFILLSSFLANAGMSQEKAAYKRSLILMGTAFEITAVSDNEALAIKSIDAAIAEIQRIERLISSWNSNSQTSVINKNAGIKPVSVDKELFDLITRSLKVSKLTEGAFDVSYAAVDKIWKFDGSMTKLPSDEDVRSSISLINFENILLNEDESTVFLKKEGMKIGFGGIGKGYAANKAMKLMKEMGITGGVVNASGDLITWGKQENGGDWRIGISDPKSPDNVMAWLVVGDMAVITSGNYEKFFMNKGKRYAHIIDPRTGYPTTGIKSVTIVCPDAELGDALATSVFVLGELDGMSLINTLKGIEGLVITDDDRLISSNNLKLNYYQTAKEKESSPVNYLTGKKIKNE